jgi:hypothetical protein
VSHFAALARIDRPSREFPLVLCRNRITLIYWKEASDTKDVFARPDESWRVRWDKTHQGKSQNPVA